MVLLGLKMPGMSPRQQGGRTMTQRREPRVGLNTEPSQVGALHPELNLKVLLI